MDLENIRKNIYHNYNEEYLNKLYQLLSKNARKGEASASP